MGYLYILLMNNKKYYIGSTKDLQWRMLYHLAGMTKTTKGKDIQLVYTQPFDTYDEAYFRERYIKKMKSKKVVEKIIHWQWKWNKDIYQNYAAIAQPVPRTFGAMVRVKYYCLSIIYWWDISIYYSWIIKNII